MTWVRFEPGFSRHPKRLRGGPIASWLWACSVDHCMTYLTDGFLDTASVRGLVPGLPSSVLTKSIAALLEVGSWQETEGGYEVHDYLEHNPSKAQVEAARASSRERYQRYVSKSNGAVPHAPNGVANALANGVANALVQRVPNEAISQSVSQSVKEAKKSKALSGKPDPAALELLDFLNRKAGRNYQPTAVNLGFISARLREGATVNQCRAVIGRKCSAWRGDPKLEPYLRPATLFNREKFAQYQGELPSTAFAEDDRSQGELDARMP